MNIKKKILVICNAPGISGGEFSLFQFLEKINKNKYIIFIAISEKLQFTHIIPGYCRIINLPFIWFTFTLNPFVLLKYTINIIKNTIAISNIINENEIEVIYSNSIKSHIYGAFIKLILGKKTIWHIRDNLKNKLLGKALALWSDKIICISKLIYESNNVPKRKKELLYGGIDSNKWKPQTIKKSELRENLGLHPSVKLIAQISQVTSWKNHPDFIKAAQYVLKYHPDVHFIIIGNCLNKKDNKYLNTLKNKIKKDSLNKYFTFLGFQKNIREIISQINILVHPAINEPFGRVIIEAMAMEKPVVAYNCGGPKEIIENNKTGFLIEPFNFISLGKTVNALLENDNLSITIGKAARIRIIEKFNITTHVKKMEEVFDNV